MRLPKKMLPALLAVVAFLGLTLGQASLVVAETDPLAEGMGLAAEGHEGDSSVPAVGCDELGGWGDGVDIGDAPLLLDGESEAEGADDGSTEEGGPVAQDDGEAADAEPVLTAQASDQPASRTKARSSPLCSAIRSR